MRDGSEVAVLLADFIGGDEVFEPGFELGLLRGVQRREAGDFCGGSAESVGGEVVGGEEDGRGGEQASE
jgi:hypothetical protein